MGELLQEMEKRPGGPKLTDNGTVLSSKGRELPPSIRDMGISFNQSSNWQLEATVPEPIFEQHIAEVKAQGRELTSGRLAAADFANPFPDDVCATAVTEDKPAGSL